MDPCAISPHQSHHHDSKVATHVALDKVVDELLHVVGSLPVLKHCRDDRLVLVQVWVGTTRHTGNYHSCIWKLAACVHPPNQRSQLQGSCTHGCVKPELRQRVRSASMQVQNPDLGCMCMLVMTRGFFRIRCMSMLPTSNPQFGIPRSYECA